MPKKQEDDLAIDFSGIGRKISSFFKSDAKAEHKAAHAAHAGEKSERKEAGQGAEEEISIDVKRIWEFIVKYRTVLILLIPLFFAVFVRIHPFYLPATDVWAKNTVDRYYQNQIMQQISQQYPNLPPENKEAIAQENLQKYINENKGTYGQQIKQVSQNFKSEFQDENGKTYLMELDVWHWFRYVRNVVDHGYIGDYIREDGIMMDSHMLAPLGARAGMSLYPYIGAYFYEIVHFFKEDLAPETAFFALPVVLMALAVIPAFLIGRKIAGDLGGFFTGMFVAVHPAILNRTIAGFADTDAVVTLFTLIIFWLFIEAAGSESVKKAAAYAALAGLSIALFSTTWYGWWYIFDFIIASMAAYIIYIVLVQRGNLKEIADIKKGALLNLAAVVLVCFVVSSFIFTIAFGVSSFKVIYTEPFSFMIIKESAVASLWPNVYTTVAELNEASLSQIVGVIGGKLMFAIAIIGILLTLTLKKANRLNPKYAIILVIWFAGTMYASTKGIRFTALLAPAFCIAVGSAVGISYKYLSAWITKELNMGRILTNIVLILIMSMLLIGPVKSANDSSKSQVPSMNDAWYGALTHIKTNSSENAIINSWWDFGHWFKAIGDRAVTFDGSTQNRPQAHWIGRVLLTSSEDEAVGILRMLDCGATLGYDKINNATGDMHKAVDLAYKITAVDREKARKILEKEIPAEKIDAILEYTHCNPPEDYFITSEDMVGKAGVWAHFGSWDFEKAKIWRDLRKLDAEDAVDFMMKEFNYSEEYAQSLYYETQSITDEREANNWISPWPGYAGNADCSAVKNDTMQCVFTVGSQVAPFQIDTRRFEAHIETTNGAVYPTSISYIDSSGNFAEKKYSNNTLPYSLTLIKKGDDYQGILMSPQLAASMFTRLFYLNGTGLRHFDKFDHKIDITGQNIIVWKVDWEGKK